jgi:hypothetical protein
MTTPSSSRRQGCQIIVSHPFPAAEAGLFDGLPDLMVFPLRADVRSVDIEAASRKGVLAPTPGSRSSSTPR